MPAAAASSVPPLPPPLRPKPQRRAIGLGKAYSNAAEIGADVVAWEAEKSARAQLVKLRTKALDRQRDKQRDRSGRKRDTQLQETDNQRRVRQRQESETASSALWRLYVILEYLLEYKRSGAFSDSGIIQRI